MPEQKAILPGRYAGLSIDEYHGLTPGVSKSALDLIHRSISHYENRTEMGKEEKPALLFGKAFHYRLLEPDKFDKFFVIDLGVDKRTKEGKAAYEQFATELNGREILKNDDVVKMDAMAEKVMAHPIAKELFSKGTAEESFFWIDPTTKLLCKCRPDYLRTDNIMVDLKTAASADIRDFQRSVGNYRYHVQDAFYRDGVGTVLNTRIDTFVFVVVEKSPPFEVACYVLDIVAIKNGREQYQDDLLKLKKSLDNPNLWKGYPKEIQEIPLPAWAVNI